MVNVVVCVRVVSAYPADLLMPAAGASPSLGLGYHLAAASPWRPGLYLPPASPLAPAVAAPGPPGLQPAVITPHHQLWSPSSAFSHPAAAAAAAAAGLAEGPPLTRQLSGS